MSLNRNDAAIARLTEDKNKSLRSMSTLLAEGKENTDAYKRLEQSVTELEADIAALRMLAVHPAIQAANAKAEQEEREQQNRALSTSVAENVTAAIVNGKDAELRHKQDIAFRTFVRTGNLDTRDLVTSSDAGGAAVIPQGYSFGAFARKYYAPMLDFLNTIVRTDGQPTKVSFLNATTTPGLTLVQEAPGSSLPTSDPVMSSNVIFSDLFTTGNINVSYQELEDADNIEALLTRIGAQRYGQGLEKILTTGSESNGTTTPNNPGLLSGVQAGLTYTTGTIAAGVQFADFFKPTGLLSLIDSAYLRSPKAAVMMHFKTALYLANQLTTTNAPIWIPNPQESLESVFGIPVVLNNSLAAPVAGTFAANSIPVLVGDFANYATVRTDGQVRVIIKREARAQVLEALVIFAARIGSTICDKNAVAAIKIASG